MLDVLALYRIQELELDIIQRTKRIKAINAQMEEDDALLEAEAKFAVAAADFEGAAKRVADMEAEIAALVEKRQAAETRLYSGEVTNPKELQDMHMEVESLARRNTVLDEEVLRLSGERDDRKQQQDEVETSVNAVREECDEQNRKLLKEKGTLTKSVNSMLKKRKRAVKKVPPEMFKTYNGMRSPKANRPISVLNENACTICGIEQNHIVILAINRNEGMVNCQSCGRILIRML